MNRPLSGLDISPAAGAWTGMQGSRRHRPWPRVSSPIGRIGAQERPRSRARRSRPSKKGNGRSCLAAFEAQCRTPLLAPEVSAARGLSEFPPKPSRLLRRVRSAVPLCPTVRAFDADARGTASPYPLCRRCHPPECPLQASIEHRSALPDARLRNRFGVIGALRRHSTSPSPAPALGFGRAGRKSARRPILASCEEAAALGPPADLVQMAFAPGSLACDPAGRAVRNVQGARHPIACALDTCGGRSLSRASRRRSALLTGKDRKSLKPIGSSRAGISSRCRISRLTWCASLRRRPPDCRVGNGMRQVNQSEWRLCGGSGAAVLL